MEKEGKSKCRYKMFHIGITILGLLIPDLKYRNKTFQNFGVAKLRNSEMLTLLAISSYKNVSIAKTDVDTFVTATSRISKKMCVFLISQLSPSEISRLFASYTFIFNFSRSLINTRRINWFRCCSVVLICSNVKVLTVAKDLQCYVGRFTILDMSEI